MAFKKLLKKEVKNIETVEDILEVENIEIPVKEVKGKFYVYDSKACINSFVTSLEEAKELALKINGSVKEIK